MKNEKIIEEMAKDICKLTDCSLLKCIPDKHCTSYRYAQRAVNAGYRKQSVGEWIRHKENCLYNKCSICSYEHCREDNYCPHCGAKMKGGME